MEDSEDNISSNSSFNYSNDSLDETRLVSLDFSKEFSYSIRKKIEYCRESISSLRYSLDSTEISTNLLRKSLRGLEEKVSLKSNELSSISNNIEAYNRELNLNSLSTSDALSTKETRFRLQTQVKVTYYEVIKVELDHLIKKHELLALQDYHKSLQKLIQTQYSDTSLSIKLKENIKKSLCLIHPTSLNNTNEVCSLYNFLYNSFEKIGLNHINHISDKLQDKLKLVLLSEIKYWSLNKSFHCTKSEIKLNYLQNSDFIRKNTKKRLESIKKDKENEINHLKNEIEKINVLQNPDTGSKSSLIMYLNVYSKHLEYLNERISKLHKLHHKSQKKIIKRTRKLGSAELKLAKLKSSYFLKDL
jgi:hypothetical protein